MLHMGSEKEHGEKVAFGVATHASLHLLCSPSLFSRRHPRTMGRVVQRAAHKVEELAAKFNVESWVRTQRRRKWRFAGRLARLSDGRWSQKVLDWEPASVRSRQRPLTRWSDQLAQFAGGNWQQVAVDPAFWRTLEEGFVVNA